MLTDTEPRAVSVSELTGHIKAILEGTFPSICVAGEISDLSRPRSGHLYFTLKDEFAQIRGVVWRSTAMRSKVQLREGDSVLCYGDVEVYPPRGTYQLVVRRVQQQGLGALQVAFEKLREKLNAEGLFAVERKRPLPRFPRRIGVVTSPSGAAISDFLQAAESRWRGVEIIVLGAQVQGDAASRSIVSAIAAAQRIRPPLDVLVVTRGGGSLEDLWSFNEERVVRAVARSRIPVVSAVGHEVDVTLCDLAADVRALTPTDGATKVLPDAALLHKAVSELQRRFQHGIRNLLESRRVRLDALQTRSMIRRPHELVQSRARQLDELDARARRSMESKIHLSKASLATVAAALSALSPLDVLTRGYSITVDESGNAITDASEVRVGSRIRTRLHRGAIESEVIETRSQS